MDDIQEITSKYATRRNIPKAKYKEDTSDESDSDDYMTSEGSKRKKSKYRKKTKSKYKESSSDFHSSSEFSFSEDEKSRSEPGTDSEHGSNAVEKGSDFEGEEHEHKMQETSNKEKKKYKKQKTKGGGKREALSAYELSLEQKRAEKMAFLKSMQIDEVKAGISEILGSLKSKRQPIKKEKAHIPKREKSERLKGSKKIDFTEKGQMRKAVRNARKEMDGAFVPPQLPLSEALSKNFSFNDFVEDIRITASSSVKFVPYDMSALKQLSLHKVGRIHNLDSSKTFGLTWYPSMEETVMAAGLSNGNICIWNVDSDSEPYRLRIHTKNVTKVQFNPFNSVQLVSASYDGSLRCCDMVNLMSSQICTVPESYSCTYFDFLSETTYLVSLLNGSVAIIDKRTSRFDYVKMHPCHDSVIRTVSLNPVNNNVFLTATSRSGFGIWDLRKLQEQPVLQSFHHRNVISAFFSPTTGNSVLTTSMDHNISIFDTINSTERIKLKKRMTHLNDRDVSAVWLPNSEEAFVVGTLKSRPGKMQFFDTDMKVYHTIEDKNLNHLLRYGVVHPFRPVVAACNLSKQLYAFS